jgi:ATP-binding protein involved in chromosome partitioning
MAKRSEPPEPCRAVKLSDGSDPISKGVVQRVRREGKTVVVDVTVEGLGDGLAARVLQRTSGDTGEHEPLEGLADSVEAFVDEVLGAMPAEAVDLRGLPPASQVRQLSQELGAAEAGETVGAVVDDPTQVIDSIEQDCGSLIAEIDTGQTGTTGALLELTRS